MYMYVLCPSGYIMLHGPNGQVYISDRLTNQSQSQWDCCFCRFRLQAFQLAGSELPGASEGNLEVELLVEALHDEDLKAA